MKLFDTLMHEKQLDAANMGKLRYFIVWGIKIIYGRFQNYHDIHPETLNILIRAIQVYNKHNPRNQYNFVIYEREDPKVDDPTIRFMNNIVREAAQRGKLFDRTQDPYTRKQLEAQREAAQQQAALRRPTDMEEVDGGAKRKRTTRTKKLKRRYKRKSQRKSKRVH